MDSGSNRIVIRKTRPNFSQEQKVGFGLVIGVGMLAFVMGGFYIGSHLSRVFDIQYDGPAVLTAEQQQAQALSDLQTTDTDGDGLTDYDELYSYRTSPYLEDTDGDGIKDGAEVAAGTDPNCAGIDCTNSSSGFDTGTQVVSLDDVSPSLSTTQEGLDLVTEVTTGVTADDVRSALLQSGVDAAQLDQLTDAQVLELYRQTIQDLNDTGQLEQLLQTDTTTQASQ